MGKNKSNSMHTLRYVALAPLIICCGCDIEIPSLRKATEQVAQYSTEQMPKETAEPSTSLIDNERASLEHFAASRLKMLADSIKKIEKGLQEIKTDRETMSKRVAEVSEKVYASNDTGAGDVLLMLLKDAAINALAYKHLGGDFSLACSEFVAKMRDAASLEREKKLAQFENKQAYSDAMNSIKDKDSSVTSRADGDIAREQHKIAEMERRVRRLHSSFRGSREDKLKREKEIRFLEMELYRARSRVAEIKRAVGRHSSNLSRTQIQRKFDVQNKDLERQYGKIKTVHQVAMEYELSTVRKLDSEMSKKELELQSAKELLDSQKVFVSSVATGMEKLGMQDLKRIRSEIEKVLGRKTEIDPKKRK